MSALTPECYAGMCVMCDSDACGCDCHFEGDPEDNEGTDICEFCGDWEPCDCDMQIINELEDEYDDAEGRA